MQAIDWSSHMREGRRFQKGAKRQDIILVPLIFGMNFESREIDEEKSLTRARSIDTHSSRCKDIQIEPIYFALESSRNIT